MTSAPILWNTNMQSSKNQSSTCSGTAQILDENDTVASHTAAFQDSLFISSSALLDDTVVKGKKKPKPYIMGRSSEAKASTMCLRILLVHDEHVLFPVALCPVPT